MAKKNNRTCIICNTGYHYCPTCGKDLDKPTWYNIFEGQNCHDIYEVCTQYRDGVVDAETAYDLISKLDISKLEEFAESTKLQIKEIFKLHGETAIKPVVEAKKPEYINDAVKKNK